MLCSLTIEFSKKSSDDDDQLLLFLQTRWLRELADSMQRIEFQIHPERA